MRRAQFSPCLSRPMLPDPTRETPRRKAQRSSLLAHHGEPGWNSGSSFEANHADGLRSRSAISPLINHRQQKQRQHRGAEQPPDDNRRQRPLNLSPGRSGKSHGYETQTGYARGHQDWPEPAPRTRQHSFPDRDPGRKRLPDRTDENDSIEHGDPEEREEADGSGEIEVHPANPESRDASDQRKRDVAHN